MAVISVWLLSLVFSAFLLTSHAHAQIAGNNGGTDLNVRIPVSAGWFAFTDEGWQEPVTGVAAARTGAELYPVGGGKRPRTAFSACTGVSCSAGG